MCVKLDFEFLFEKTNKKENKWNLKVDDGAKKKMRSTIGQIGFYCFWHNFFCRFWFSYFWRIVNSIGNNKTSNDWWSRAVYFIFGLTRAETWIFVKILFCSQIVFLMVISHIRKEKQLFAFEIEFHFIGFKYFFAYFSFF